MKEFKGKVAFNASTMELARQSIGAVHRACADKELRNEPVMKTPEMQAGLAAFSAAIEASMPPLKVAAVVSDAIEKAQFYILPQPEWTKVIQIRADKLLGLENPQSPAGMIAKLVVSAGESFTRLGLSMSSAMCESIFVGNAGPTPQTGEVLDYAAHMLVCLKHVEDGAN
jgi:hypothetical protein